MYDLIIIGAGPAGITAALEAKKAGLEYAVIEKGLIGNTVYNYPVGLTVFSTVNELEINEGELKPAREKPTREELLSYYVRVVLDNDLNVRTEEKVLSVTAFTDLPPRPRNAATPPKLGGESERREPPRPRNAATPPKLGGESERREPPRPRNAATPPKLGGESGAFVVTTDKAEYEARNVLFAIGAMDHPRKLNVPGEDLPKVHDHFRETYPWVKKRALVVGGGNSAGEAALFLAEEGADTTLAIFREDWENNDPKQGCIKYWVKQPLEAELKKHCLKLFFLGKVIEIAEDHVLLEDENGKREKLANDVVFVLVGSDADLAMIKNLGVETAEGKYGEVPVYDEATFETNVAGVYVAGHFTNQRHIKGAIDAAKALVPIIAERLKNS